MIICYQTSARQPYPRDEPLSTGWESSPISSATQGTVWKPKRIHSDVPPRQDESTRVLASPKEKPLSCYNWAVITTIFAPTTLAHQLAGMSDWCVVVVGDRKSEDTPWRKFVSSLTNVYYLSFEDQSKLSYSIIAHLKPNHFGRKNLGYLYAIHHGASFIWDTDDDNILTAPEHLDNLVKFASSSAPVDLLTSTHHLWNPYHSFTHMPMISAMPESTRWPRGFPLQYVNDVESRNNTVRKTISTIDVGVYQSLANNDPDVDAIYRLTKEIPMSFLGTGEKISLRPNQYAPFNAQATLWSKNSFWALLLPVSVHGRVSDIWRSYIAEKLMSYTQKHVAFVSPVVTQHRNVHNLIADLQSEFPLYTQADEFTKWLLSWEPPAGPGDVPSYMSGLFRDMYAIGLIKKKEVLLCDAWIADLKAMGYIFDEIKSETSMLEKDIVKDYVDVNTKRTPRVAVCVSGQLRTLTLSPDSEDHPHGYQPMRSILPPPNMTVAQSIQRNLYSKLFNPDVFMHVATRETEHEPTVNDTSVCEPLRPPGGRLFCAVDKEVEVPKLDTPIWNSFTQKNRRAEQGLLQQMSGLFQCYSMIEKHMLTTGTNYDWIARVRPDNYFHNVPSLESLLLDSKRPTVWYSNPKYCCCGNEDSFGIAPARYMKHYFQRFLYFQQTEWEYLKHDKPLWNSESHLQGHLLLNGVLLKKHSDIQICCVKPRHRRRGSDP